MNTLPDALDQCPACGDVNSTKRACSSDCMRTSATNFSDISTIGSTSAVHLHVTCERCKFEWLEQTWAPDQVKAAW